MVSTSYIQNVNIPTLKAEGSNMNNMIRRSRTGEANLLDHMTIDWGSSKDLDFFPFFFFPPFLLLLFVNFSSAIGCVLRRYWWMAAKGSDWNVGLLRTMLKCFPSFKLITMNPSCIKNDFSTEDKESRTILTIQLDVNLGIQELTSTFVWIYNSALTQ